MPRHLRETSLPVPAPVPSDLLEGFFHQLVANLLGLDPGALHRPVRVAEIHERLVPYRTHRVSLGFDTNEDYEMTLLRLLAGERGLAQVFPAEVAEAFAREAAVVNPDTGLFRQFPDATVLLNPEQAASTGEHAAAVMPAADENYPATEESEESVLSPLPPPPSSDEEEESSLPFALDESEDVRATTQPREIVGSVPCNYCGGSLPVGRTVLFCPHCGQNIGVVHCPTCGSELDVGWGFCITCGQKVSGLG